MLEARAVDAVESAEYFEKRSLKDGAIGRVPLVGPGVNYIVSGDSLTGATAWNTVGGWIRLSPGSSWGSGYRVRDGDAAPFQSCEPARHARDRLARGERGTAVRSRWNETAGEILTP